MQDTEFRIMFTAEKGSLVGVAIFAIDPDGNGCFCDAWEVGPFVTMQDQLTRITHVVREHLKVVTKLR